MDKPLEVLVTSQSDWTELFINGEKVFANHILYGGDVLRILEARGLIKVERRELPDEEE